MRFVESFIRNNGTGEWVQILPPDMSVGANLSFTGVTTSVSLGGSAVIRVACDQDCYINFGTSGVTAAAGDMLIPAGKELVAVPDGATHMAAIQVSSAGTLNWRKLG